MYVERWESPVLSFSEVYDHLFCFSGVRDQESQATAAIASAAIL